MRISVFGRGSNPAVDRHIQRKSLTFAIDEVAAGRAHWVSFDDQSRGIICRQLIHFGERQVYTEPPSESSPTSDKAMGLKFVGPPNPLPHFCSNLGPQCPWDWTESAMQAQSPLLAAQSL
jgi:hypothetical protein